MEHGGYLIVPKSRQGMVELMAGEGEGGEDDLLYIALSAEEARALRPLMRAFQQSFGFDAEGATVEQLIDTRHAAAALELAETSAKQAEHPAARSAALKMAQSLDALMHYGSFVEFAL